MDESKRSIQPSQDLGQWPTGAKRTFTASGWRKFQAKLRHQAQPAKSDSQENCELSSSEPKSA